MTNEDFNSRTIFVAVPTLEDYEYAPTIKSLFDNAKYPERVFVGSPIYVVSEEQITDPDYKKFWELDFDYPKDNYKSKFFIHKDNAGVGKGRLNALEFFNNEYYYLQVDSHMRFKEDWDVHMINEYEECKEFFGDRVLYGQYAPAYTINNIDGKQIEMMEDSYKYPIWTFDETRLYDFPVGWDFTFFFLEDRRFKHKDKLINGKYLPATKHCAHNLFTESDPWITKHGMCLSPDILFWGEEFYQAALAWMRGYEFCWSINSYVTHRYSGYQQIDVGSSKDQVSNTFNKDLEGNIIRDYFGEIETDKKYKYMKYSDNKEGLEKEVASIVRLKDYLSGDFGYVPRSFEGYLIWSGVNLKNKQTKDAFYLPPLNPVFKTRKGPDTNATTP